MWSYVCGRGIVKWWSFHDHEANENDPDARFHLVAVAEWVSLDDFVAALKNPELQKIAEAATDHSPNYPGLYEVIRT